MSVILFTNVPLLLVSNPIFKVTSVPKMSPLVSNFCNDAKVTVTSTASFPVFKLGLSTGEEVVTALVELGVLEVVCFVST